ncbi:hypothetical protein B1C78_15195, partial [Thioalkalivibrio denitrificans]
MIRDPRQDTGNGATEPIRSDIVPGSQPPPRPRSRGMLWLRRPTVQRRLIAMGVIILLLGLSYAQWPRSAESFVYDLAARLMPVETDLSRVAFVDTGPAPVDYDLLARGVDALGAQGADRAGIYLPLDRRQSPPDMQALILESRRGALGAPTPAWLGRLDRDARLADALRRHGGIVLPAFPGAGADADGHASRISPGFVTWHAHPSLAFLTRPPGPVPAPGAAVQRMLHRARAVGS